MESVPQSLDLCKICLNECDSYENPAICCEGKCQQKVHVRCLSRGALPSNLIGDVFYDLYCTTCSNSKDEFVIRQKLPWLTAVILTLYNLREKSSGISRRGYFHWKSDISMFINNNWNQLFTKSVKRKKNWIGTISGTLSHYSGLFFKSGTSELGDQGWWKLIDNDPPEVLVNKYYKVLKIKKEHQAKLKSKNIENFTVNSNISSDICDINGVEDVKIEEDNTAVNLEETEADSNNEISTSIPTCEEFEDILDLDIDIPNIEDFPSFNLSESAIVEELPFESSNQLPQEFVSDCLDNVLDTIEESDEDVDVSETNIEDCQESELLKIKCDTEQLNEQKECNESNKNTELPPPTPSLFNQTVRRPWPWDESIKLDPDKVRPLMSEREEEFLLQKIEQYKHLLDTAPPTVRRLYRKLANRKLKRQYGLPLLNIDTFGKETKKDIPKMKKKCNTVLDRFISEDMSIFFEQRLQGHCEPTSVHSPYTNRLLKPYIRRDVTSCPLWLTIMNELLAKVNSKRPGWKPRRNAPIDYSYIRPQHVPAINSLCHQFFWPGIDLTECLQYPDFTCVVLYKKVVVGFAIMVPDVGYNEAYISFLLVRPEWRRAGIGRFILYHLVQTCMGKDITLHVSATNTALILYQKFGFKQEEFVQDFYEKYIPPSSKESKHALFLRLSR
ncbi:PREDICTED: cysteine-rich protein 2-binding protein [Ceratosolen solmsi marchali]|uniref:Cysteine-rich protein 2-binding protein n=1 Tax=Ceratosolen solmsi marchali TaxID=326594 RepID=A0AAJ7DZY6_9HYME|nr:PREDICTED: cysteine-rich protein 2-binding protein [Ceratosolen solmsi marchali]